MRVFLTGATGFVGSAIVPELLAAGHEVLGLTRSQEGARALAAGGVEPHLGDVEDLESLSQGAARADAVIHTAFDHGFTDAAQFVASCEKDRRAIAALGAPLAGTSRPLIVTSGTPMGSAAPGETAREEVFAEHGAHPRTASEQACAALSAAGANVSVVRLPQVHNTVKQGLVSYLAAIARQAGVSAYVGDGANRWPAAHVLDVARLYVLALEKAEPGARYHAVAEEGVAMRDIARAIGESLGIPVAAVAPGDAERSFGWMASFAALDMPASSARTRAALGWRPAGPGLIADLRAMERPAA